MKTIEEIKKILSDHREEFKENYSVKTMEIFGSFVRGEQKEKSDVDILIEFENVPDLLEFIKIESYFEKLLGLKVDLVRKKVLREELKTYVLKEAIMV